MVKVSQSKGPGTAERRNPDNILLIVTLLLLIGGTVMIYSTSSIIAQERFGDGNYFLKKQLFFVLVGLVAMWGFLKLPYHRMNRKIVAYGGIALSLVLLLLLFVPGLGTTVKGATRWLRLCGFSFQVSEFVKIALVVFLAHYLSKKITASREFLRFFAVPLGVTILIVTLVLKQPDFGTAVIMVSVLMAMLYVVGGRIVYLAGFVAASVPVAIFLVMHEQYRMKRIMTFLNPWDDPQGAGFHIIQSFLSFGSGGVCGVGLGDSMQKLFYLPEPHTDFIFSIIGEELGFVGVSIVILLFVLFIVRGLTIAFQSGDLFGTLLAAGLTTVIGLEACINMAAVMGLIPTKGLVLPFLSYGGTSLIMCMVLVGILLNISTYGQAEKKQVRVETKS